MITENVSTLKIHKLTQEQYDTALAAGSLDENALYLTPDGESVLTINNVNGLQTALDNLQDDIDAKASTSHTHTEYAPSYTYGTADLTAGTSALETGKLYFVYE